MSQITARLNLDSTSFTAGLNKAVSAVGSAAGRIAGLGAKITGIFAGIGVPISGAAFAAGIKGALDYGSALDDLKARTGGTIPGLINLQQAFQDAGLGADAVGPMLNRLQKAMSGVNEEGQPTNKALASLGLNLDQLRTLTPDQQFEAVGKAITGIKDPAERAAVAMQIFGKSGGQLLAVFAGGPTTAANSLKTLGGIMEKNLALFDRMADIIGSVGTQFKAFFAGVADQIAPALRPLLEAFNNIDFASLGQKLTASLKPYVAQAVKIVTVLVNAIKQGRVGELLSLSLKIGFGEAINYMDGAMRSVLLGLTSIITNMFSKDFGLGVADVLMGSIELSLARLQTQLQDVLITGAAVLQMGFERAIKVFYTLKDFFGTIVSYIEAGLKTAIQKAIAILPDFVKPEGFKEKTFQENFADAERGRVKLSADFKPSTFQQALADQRQAVPAFSKALGERGQALLNKGLERLKNYALTVAEDFKAIGADFKPSDLINTKEWRDKLSELSTQLNIPLADLEKLAERTAGVGQEMGDAAAGAAGKLGEAIKNVRGETDSFAKIGLFAGESNPLTKGLAEKAAGASSVIQPTGAAAAVGAAQVPQTPQNAISIQPVVSILNNIYTASKRTADLLAGGITVKGLAVAG